MTDKPKVIEKKISLVFGVDTEIEILPNPHVAF